MTWVPAAQDFLKDPVKYDGSEPVQPKEYKLKPYAEEYAVSGWFKWTPNEAQTNLYFRLTPDSTPDSKLLNMYIGKEDGQYRLFSSTQSYRNKDLAIEDTDYTSPFHDSNAPRLALWHFVYMGYSKKLHQVYSLVWFRDSEFYFTSNNIYHYLSKQFYLYISKDASLGDFQGHVAYLKLSVGQGYSNDDDKIQIADDFYFQTGLKSLVPADSHQHSPDENEWDGKD